MFVVWGKKLTYQKIGHVADFCPLCCEVRAFTLERVGLNGHLYYVSVGKGELAGYQRCCAHCRHTFSADPEHYTAFAEQPLELAALISKTYPDIAEVQRARLSLERALRDGPVALPDDVRRHLLMEPFQLLSPKFAEYQKKSGFQFEGGFLRKQIIPVLGSTLSRLRPTEHELGEVLTRLAQLKDPLGKRLKLADLVKELQGRADGSIGQGIPAAALGAGGGSVRDPHQQASRVLMWLSIVAAVVVVCMAISFGIPLVTDGIRPHDAAWLVISGTLAGGIISFILQRAVAQRKSWGCNAAMAFSALLLLSIPVGTIVGGYLLWQLVLARKQVEPAAATA